MVEAAVEGVAGARGQRPRAGARRAVVQRRDAPGAGRRAPRPRPLPDPRQRRRRGARHLGAPRRAARAGHVRGRRPSRRRVRRDACPHGFRALHVEVPRLEVVEHRPAGPRGRRSTARLPAHACRDLLDRSPVASIVCPDDRPASSAAAPGAPRSARPPGWRRAWLRRRPRRVATTPMPTRPDRPTPRARLGPRDPAVPSHPRCRARRCRSTAPGPRGASSRRADPAPSSPDPGPCRRAAARQIERSDRPPTPAPTDPASPRSPAAAAAAVAAPAPDRARRAHGRRRRRPPSPTRHRSPTRSPSRRRRRRAAPGRGRRSRWRRGRRRVRHPAAVAAPARRPDRARCRRRRPDVGARAPAPVRTARRARRC